mmetsp:Transcript_5075/g.14734  ORF Transcript_5075/g.14734 Transcript_5075/m.14734 type:complete len:369 (-) Transcript_5075:42-1148(-)|eukprot:CAMPEP_0172361828 /NCGR_PEP_ID=MMETSP1060-20121228/5597_1 /TAXON_ID=37318 /ORGANISM="Pseudo-nitzschia pungens, Strain cf. cingulata" /LENGTH=368 /DNA_ID=CAMNT_0013084209 /DNA_START=121 /DNA_END=1227 /DNA_ORIENTATION=+
MQICRFCVLFVSVCHSAVAFTSTECRRTSPSRTCRGKSHLFAEPTTEQEKAAVKTEQEQSLDVYLAQPTQGGYTLKQRLREEIDSPFRKVRLAAFAGSFASALIALYFSALSTIKATVGGYSDAMPLDEALTSDAINLAAVVACGYFTYREIKNGQANLEKIARAGKLASLVVEPAGGVVGSSSSSSSNKRGLLEMKSYRRSNRVLIAAGGRNYIASLAKSLASDQLRDTNIIPEKLLEVDVVIVPVLLEERNQRIGVGDTRAFWREGVGATVTKQDRDFDIDRANDVVSFPRGPNAWIDYLNSDIETATGQGFDVLEKGITITVKKNGKILRRATGLPPFGDLIGTMEVADGSKFGMPGDSERYGGP